MEEIIALLDRGANIEVRDEGGWTPLMFAAHCDNIDLLTTLLDRGANIEATNNQGRSVISYAHGHLREILLNRRHPHTED